MKKETEADVVIIGSPIYYGNLTGEVAIWKSMWIQDYAGGSENCWSRIENIEKMSGAAAP